IILNKESDEDDAEHSLQHHIESLHPVDYIDIHLLDDRTLASFIQFIKGFFYAATKQKTASVISTIQQPVIAGKLAEEIVLRPILNR
ncbi:MAG: hypothetical protein HY860_03260, partial [Chlamydiales bacterium]|nr:hypothetical protein [Chlamydiales bacterium]